mmetsp:Transcript_44947/g.105969  ORF Transcript_44947/g.105969 Transcript_44947/m.105969 type:complete len:92 (-) Transcript_44947:13-288(-)
MALNACSECSGLFAHEKGRGCCTCLIYASLGDHQTPKCVDIGALLAVEADDLVVVVSNKSGASLHHLIRVGLDGVSFSFGRSDHHGVAVLE